MDVCAFVVGGTATLQRRSPAVRAGVARHGTAVRMVAAAPTEVTPQEKENYANFVMNTYARYDVILTEGKGMYLYDQNGKEYLDFVSGIATCALGHANPVLNEAVMKQMNKLHHVSNLFYIPEQAGLAKWLVEHSPADKVFFCNSGAEANEAAIKLARKYAATKRGIKDGVILTATQSFHGRTMATVTATGQTKYQNNFSPLVPGFDYVKYNDEQSLEDAFQKYGDRVIGVMLEACQGEGGVKPGSNSFFQKARQFCIKADALLIMDEVQVGVGRTGKLWGFENLGIEPDVFTLAKGLGGGVPIGAMLCKEKFNVFQPGDHASTFGGNPLSCAAGLAVVNIIGKPSFLMNVEARAEQLRAKLQALAKQHPDIIVDIRGWGLLQGIELNSDCGLVSSDFVRLSTANGLLLVPAGPTVVRFVPPLIISEEEMTKALEIFEKVLNSLLKEK
eukprot:Plantae.Rhodophyta-Purpureofilum_apyrenoidigerum.ctg6851.p1 GENE.Plantae.Rhodophyta-Purpureofilum_apyrenoidigerum.ctg6851~~Plantae.Rhodophyta-Purpureofilum_apyrenoidigerum.ctg6851.p1  ORF type:complete len:448 (-),score=82.36 Plantae.Rhodophyta-Purpureofilum_apyrenoidigerum.ctg6851:1152-2495(-)